MRSQGRIVALLVALCAMLTACSEPAPTATTEASAVRITVGSNESGQSQLVGAMLIVALEQRGAQVINQLGFGSTAQNRDGLLEGDLDVYPEDITTGWRIHLGQLSTEEMVSDDVAALLVQRDRPNGVTWTAPSPFDGGVGIVTRPRDDGSGVWTFADLAEAIDDNTDAMVCVTEEFVASRDGLVRFESSTGFTVPNDQLRVLADDQIATEIDKGRCLAGALRRTDGRVQQLDLVAIGQGSDGVFFPANVAYSYRSDVYEVRTALLAELSDDILATLDEATMTRLNEQVEVRGRDPLVVAREHLTESGLL